jgi:predicted nuclease of predicted toxin-antitoxin system
MFYGQPPKLVWLKMGNQSKAATIKTLQDYSKTIEQALITDDHECIEIL